MKKHKYIKGIIIVFASIWILNRLWAFLSVRSISRETFIRETQSDVDFDQPFFTDVIYKKMYFTPVKYAVQFQYKDTQCAFAIGDKEILDSVMEQATGEASDQVEIQEQYPGYYIFADSDGVLIWEEQGWVLMVAMEDCSDIDSLRTIYEYMYQ